MYKIGKVISLRGKRAVLQTNRPAACQNCAARDLCPKNKPEETLVINEINAQPGEDVVVYLKSVNLIHAIGIAYGLPLLFFILGILAGWFLAPVLNLDQVLTSFFVGIVSLGLSYGIIYGLDRKGWLNLKYQPRIVSLATKDQVLKDQVTVESDYS